MQQAGLRGAKLIMEDVGMRPRMDIHSLLVQLVIFTFFFKFPYPFPLVVDSGFQIITLTILKQDNGNVKCSCPPGFKGDGVKSCEGMDTEILGCLVLHKFNFKIMVK